MNLPNTLKICNTCDEAKPRTEFSRRSLSKDGLQGRCKTCFSAYSRVTKGTLATANPNPKRSRYLKTMSPLEYNYKILENPHAKLSELEVMYIRNAYDGANERELSNECGVPKSLIVHIVKDVALDRRKKYFQNKSPKAAGLTKAP
jgi:hypothetical protein